MLTCKSCRRNCRALSSILVVGAGSLSAWRVECCGKCKAFYKSQNDQQRKAREKQYRK